MFSRENKYLILIVIIFIAACIETDIYLPAFPDMMSFFSVTGDEIQGLVTWNMVGMCLSCPFYGPISDAIGRRKPLIFALSLFLIGSLATVFTSSFNAMLFGRILQGLGSGGCFTLGTAIIFDTFENKKAMKVMNQLSAIIPLIMAFAPMLGGYLNYNFGFRSNFITITLFVLFSSLICLLWFEETLVGDHRIKFNSKKLLNDFQRVFLSADFWLISLVMNFVFGGYIAFLTGISALFVSELGVSREALPVFQMTLLASWLAGNRTFNRVVDKWGIPSIKRMGAVLVFIGGVGVFLASCIAPLNPIPVTALMMIYTFGSNWVFGTYFPEGMQLFLDIKGISAGLFTSIRFLLVSLILAISSLTYNKTIYPIAALVFGVSLLATLCVFLYERRTALKAQLVP